MLIDPFQEICTDNHSILVWWKFQDPHPRGFFECWIVVFRYGGPFIQQELCPWVRHHSRLHLKPPFYRPNSRILRRIRYSGWSFGDCLCIPGWARPCVDNNDVIDVMSVCGHIAHTWDGQPRAVIYPWITQNDCTCKCGTIIDSHNDFIAVHFCTLPSSRPQSTSANFSLLCCWQSERVMYYLSTLVKEGKQAQASRESTSLATWLLLQENNWGKETASEAIAPFQVHLRLTLPVCLSARGHLRLVKI